MKRTKNSGGVIRKLISGLLLICIGAGAMWFIDRENINKSDKTINEQKLQLTERDSLIIKYQEQLSAFSIQVAGLISAGESKDATIAALNTIKENLTNTVTELNGLVESLGSDNSALSLLVASYENTITQLNSLISYLSDTIYEWENRTEYIVTFYVNSSIWAIQVITTPGANPSLPAVPTGAFFGWSLDGTTVIDPTQISITADTKFYAITFADPVSFATDSEATLNYVVNAIKAGADPMSFPYRVGDKRDITLNTSEVVTFEIWGIQHDDLSDGSGKAPYTLGMENLLATKFPMSADTNIGGWAATPMRNITLQAIFLQLPEFWQNFIKTVDKKTTVGGAIWPEPATAIQTTEDKLFLFSRKEIDNNTVPGFKDEGQQYEYWRTIKDGSNNINHNNADIIKKLSNGTGNKEVWYFRSPDVESDYAFYRVNAAGAIFYNSPSLPAGVCFGFCI